MWPKNRMDREINIDSIRAQEEQVREHEGAIIQLKRTRNSLLNVYKLPPEVLGKIFWWNIPLEGDFDGLDERSHNFLLVCRRWFEVASQTPEIWSFWGNTPKDWARFCHRSRTVPLDLVFYYDHGGYFNTTLRNVLQDRATRDTIRLVHLVTRDSELLSSIIASLTSNSKELRSNGVESLILRNESEMPVNVSNFFANCRFPKLRRLELTDCIILPWDHLKSRTPILTTLKLDFNYALFTPTAPQLLSILASNPTLQQVALIGCAIPGGGGGGRSSFRMQLRHLKELRLQGNLRPIVKLLHQFYYPGIMEKLSLDLHDCNAMDISQIIGPYLRDNLQRHGRPRNGLNLFVSSSYRTHGPCTIVFRAGDAGGIDLSAPEWIDPFIEITMRLDRIYRMDELERATLDLISHVPREEVVYFQTHGNPVAMEDASTQFPNVRALSLDAIHLPVAFPSPKPVGDRMIFPALGYVSLKGVLVNNGDWSPFINFLVRRVSSKNRLDTVVITGFPYLCPEVVESIRDLVQTLKIT